MTDVWVPMRYMRELDCQSGRMHHRVDIGYIGGVLTMQDSQDLDSQTETFQDDIVLDAMRAFLQRVPSPDPAGFFTIELPADIYARHVKGCGKQFIWEPMLNELRGG